MGIVSLLRNFASDAVRGRVTAPADMMIQNSVLPQDILAGRTTVQIIALLGNLRDVAVRHYEEARVLIEREGHDAIAALLPGATMPPGPRPPRPYAHEPIPRIGGARWRRPMA